MSTFNVTIKATSLGVSIENITDSMASNFGEAMRAVAIDGYNEVVRLAQARLDGLRLDYLKGLRMTSANGAMASGGGAVINKGEVSGNYVIELADSDSKHGMSPSRIEEGWAPFDMKPFLINGPRSKARKDGGRYNIVPFSHHPFKTPRNDAEKSDIKSLTDVLKRFNLNKVIKDEQGNGIEGIVGRASGDGVPQNLQGLMRIQKNYGERSDISTHETLGATTQSQYLTMRVVSDRSKPGSWLNPGYSGAKIFPDAEKHVEANINKIIEEILK